MKKKIIFSTTILSSLFLATCFLSSSQDSKKVEPKITQSAQVLSQTASVTVPEEVSFAGETTKLDRYDLFERYDREINSFTYFHSSTLLLIKRANRYFPIIEPILKENGIPDDFKYLAVIESFLEPRAISPAKAAGLWQFMPATGKQFRLEVGTEVDERFSVEKSTEAACKYLKSAYNTYKSWSAVAMSYNAGMGRISGELDKQLAEDSLDLWLVEETARYYFRMVAIKYVFENPSAYGFVLTADQLYKPIDFKRVQVSSTIDLASFAKDQGVTYAQLKDFNPWLRDRKLTISPKSTSTYTILIPTQESLYYKKGELIRVHNQNWLTK